ncbi:WS/DGAT/MGAT family O-acyltransferase [Nocardia spumae]|uniref:WS/DGAT/MGAT family O-acyltransferase n=1 Tax=Nocardia spumae TaxID=2887190 RepID=UPI001D15AF39|nr:wax ester/triacylglycerol synthase family O-acyltransferase [Nocardia spumae]
MGPSDTTVLDARTTTVYLSTPGESIAGVDRAAPAPARSVTTIPHAASFGPPRRLSPLDLHLLDSETSSTPLHIGAIMLLDSAHAAGGALEVSALRRLFAARLHLVAPLRHRIRTVPLGLDQPYWEDCTTVDLGFHVRDVLLPDGATDEDLAEYVARCHAQPLERSRPLWECHLVSGLSGGRQAVYTKVHHAVIDGVSAAEIMAAVLDISETPTTTPVPESGMRRDRTPSPIEMLARSLPNAVVRQSARARAAMQAGPALVRARDDLRYRHPDVPFNGPITPIRSVAYVSLPLDVVKAVKKSVDGTVNDVVMALCTSALRNWMRDRGLPTDRPLLAAVPTSVRTPEQFGTAGNQFSVMLAPLPINEADPRHRLKLLRNDLLVAKERFRAQPATVLHQITSLLSPILHGVPTRALLRAAAPALPLANVIVSNVAGPQIPLYLNGIRVLAGYPVSVLTELSGSLNITVMSYNGRLDFGILACPDTVPDVGHIAQYLRQALTELDS